jgi:N-acetylmuramoyl-L-alanine amidase
MVSIFRAFVRNLASFGGLLLALGCLVWLVLLREDQPRTSAGWEVSPEWHEEGGVDEGEKVAVEEEKKGGEEMVGDVKGEEEGGKVVKRERPLVVVDAGHGGGDGGAVWNGIVEKNLALTLALKLKAQLEKLGIDVQMTRSKDVFVSLENRAALANRVKADAFVSVHLNSAGNESGVRGIETYYCLNKSLPAVRALQAAFQLKTTVGLRDRRGEKLAAAVQRQVCQGTGSGDRGTKERAYTVVHGTSCPAVLVECGFISNPKEATLLKTRAYQEKLAGGIARGVATFLHGQELDPARGLDLPKIEGPELHGPPVKPDLLSQK